MPADAPPLMADESAVLAGLLQASLGGESVTLPNTYSERCSIERAYALQGLLQRRLLERIGGSAIGIKLGGTSPAALAGLGLDSPFTGPLLSARCRRSPARLPRQDFKVCVVEAEVAVRIGRDIAPRTDVPSIDELTDAIEAVYPAIEIADSRLQNWSSARACDIVADLGYSGAWVQGEACTDWRTLDLATVSVSLSCDGKLVREGSGALVLGHPLHALGLSVAAMGRRGLGLKAGTLVSTGSCAPPWPHADRGHIVADFGLLGRVELDLV